MSITTIERRQLAYDTAANWTAQNPILAMAEEGYETDTGKSKIGNGATAWSSLAYEPSRSANTFTGVQTISDTTESSSTSTGCLVLAGGLGLAKKLTGVNAAFSGAVATGALTVTGLTIGAAPNLGALNTHVATGYNIGLGYTSGYSILSSVNDANSAYVPLAIQGLSIQFNTGATGATIHTLSSTGLAVTGHITEILPTSYTPAVNYEAGLCFVDDTHIRLYMKNSAGDIKSVDFTLA